MNIHHPLAALPPLLPVNFFKISASIPKVSRFSRLGALPSTSFLLHEESFAEVKMGWNEEELLIEVIVDKAFEECSLSAFAASDTIELFVDTRDLKSAGYATKFCHHFLILPKEVEGILAQEISRFRTADSHPLSDPSAIKVDTRFGRKQYTVQITLSAACLHGYDPRSIKKLGFTYTCNRFQGAPQNFSLSCKEYSPMQHPSRWASLSLGS